jgi:predicted short-subunit dehydrogenase-like oxidoreductase (DUF2520 family)
LIGAGNVSWHLGRHLHKCGYEVLDVYSRTPEKAMTLAEELDASWSSEFNDIPAECDLYLLMVPDDAIAEVAASLSQNIPPNSLVMHTSGATPAGVLSPYFPRHGVFYPLQTFSQGREVDFTEVPLCLYTALPEDYPKVEQLAQTLVKNVYAIDDRQRAQLHLAAVFVNNFTNYLQFISREITSEHELSADLLQPLLRETIAKLDTLSPLQAQTGPAVRGDELSMNRHLKMLEKHPEWAEIYRLLSQGIQNEIANK